MFIDYYALLHISSDATPEEIKKAYIELIKIWHPDRNHSPEAVPMTQKLNEAYMILKNPKSRQKYDEEYRLFKASHISHAETKREDDREQKQSYEGQYDFEQYSYEEYEFNDELLKEWIERARAKAHELNDVTLEDIGGMTKAAAGTFCSTIKSGCLPIIILNIIALLILCSIN